MRSKQNHLYRLLILSLTCLLLHACSNRPTAYDLHGKRGALQPQAHGYYRIKQGDTLFGISWRYGLDMDELAKWNHIDDPNRILAGAKIRLEPPRGVAPLRVIAPRVTRSGQTGWQWPARGQVVSEYDANRTGLKGIKISGQRGQAIYAANAGEVAYVGTELSGFGRMVIIRHPSRVLSAYGYLEQVMVREGQQVRKGQQLATMGISPQRIPALYFETRKQGKPVNPYGYIGSVQR